MGNKEAELKQIVTEIGMGPMEDEYDIPAFIRRRADWKSGDKWVI